MRVEILSTDVTKEPADAEDIGRDSGYVEGGLENDHDDLVREISE